MIQLPEKRIMMVAGHYGSGKTEFCLNMALEYAAQGRKTALVDLDIVNPYFRTRDKAEMLEEKGIKVYGDFFQKVSTMEIPSLGANARAPLEDSSTFSIVDLGGNSAGALVAVQFSKYFQPGMYECLDVINKNRPETRTIESAAAYFHDIEERTELQFTGLINNNHLLRETNLSTLKEGVLFCRELSKVVKVPLLFTTYPYYLAAEIETDPFFKSLDYQILPINFAIRETWLDRKL